MQFRDLKTRAVIAAAAMTVTISGLVHAQPAYVNGVPDWDQPVLAGEPNGGNGAYGAWCVPTATGNIIGYYEDIHGVGNIGDGFVFPNTVAPGATNWQDDTADWAMGQRQDLGWFMNTNDLGASGGAGAHRGTRVQEIFAGPLGFDGLGGPNGYFRTRGHNFVTITNYGADRMAPNIYGAFDNSGDAQNLHTLNAGFAEIIGEVDGGRPLLAHFDHFSLLNRRNHDDTGNPDDFFPESDRFDSALFSENGGNGDEGTGEVWRPSEGLGHTVTVVGYWMPNDASNPFFGSPAIIVHDNFDGFLAGGQPLPLVLPWTAQTPWMGLTEFGNVPAPGALAVFGVGALAMARRRR